MMTLQGSAPCIRCFAKLHLNCYLCSAVLCCACKLTDLHLSSRRSPRVIRRIQMRPERPGRSEFSPDVGLPWYRKLEDIFRRLFA